MAKIARKLLSLFLITNIRNSYNFHAHCVIYKMHWKRLTAKIL